MNSNPATTTPTNGAGATEVAPASSPTFSPLYQQIKALITQGLESGEWKPGEIIPSEVELAHLAQLGLFDPLLGDPDAERGVGGAPVRPVPCSERRDGVLHVAYP